MRVLFILTCVVFVFLGCKKKGKAYFTLKGIIVDKTLNMPLVNAEVKFYEKAANSNSLKLIRSIKTNSNGEYYFLTPRNQVQSYLLSISKNNYFEISEVINFSIISIEEDNIYNYTTTMKAWAKLHFVNLSGFGSINYTVISGKKNCEECCTSTQQVLSNFSDTSVYCINDGNSTFTYSYFIPGTTLIGEKTGVTSSLDTTEILFTF